MFIEKFFLSMLILSFVPAVAGQKLDTNYYKWREENLKRMDLESCHKALESEQVTFDKKASFLKEQVCDAKNLVLVKKIENVDITPDALMTCDLALKFAVWTKNSIQIEAKKNLGTDLISIRHSGTYACRKMRTIEFISEHAFANAIDIPEFRFKNGTKIKVINGWKGTTKERSFLKAIHKGACGLFPVALGPEYDTHHKDHLHVDMGPLTLCK